MPRSAPEPAAGDLPRVVPDEPLQLKVGNRFDRDRRRRDDHRDHVEGVQRPGRERRPHAEQPGEDDERRHQLNAGEADQPPGRSVPLTDLHVAPVFVTQAAPASGPVGGEADRPDKHEDVDKDLAGAPVCPGEGDDGRGDTPVGVVEAGVADQRRSQKDDQSGGDVGPEGDRQRVVVVEGMRGRPRHPTGHQIGHPGHREAGRPGRTGQAPPDPIVHRHAITLVRARQRVAQLPALEREQPHPGIGRHRTADRLGDRAGRDPAPLHDVVHRDVSGSV
jgi:hypothetical protein